ncbi:MAG: SWIM zinc finger family protein [Desulfobacteraceae bacterium]|nr:SWIM zinc finger family protein [Desulfobacteraceae bacterium]
MDEPRSPEEQKRKVSAQEQYFEMQVVCTGGFFFEVMKLDSGKRYAVDLRKMTCTCPDHKEREIKCKHIWRVELEGYEGPIDGPEKPFSNDHKSQRNWELEGDVPWFDARLGLTVDELKKNCLCLVAPGKKKDYKFWAAFVDMPNNRILLCWGDCNQEEAFKRHPFGQIKAVDTGSPYTAAKNRYKNKLSKEYYSPDIVLHTALVEGLLENLVTARFSTPSDASASEPKEKAENKKIEEIVKPDDVPVWF